MGSNLVSGWCHPVHWASVQCEMGYGGPFLHTLGSIERHTCSGKTMPGIMNIELNPGYQGNKGVKDRF